MRSMLAAAILAVAWMYPAAADPIATACVNNANRLLSIEPYSNHPRSCPSGSKAVALEAKLPGIITLNGIGTLRDSGIVALVRGRPPFEILMTLNADDSCEMWIRFDPGALPVYMPGPTGSTIIHTTTRDLLNATPGSIFVDNTVQEFVSQGRASIRITGVELSTIDRGVCVAGVTAEFARPYTRRFNVQ